MPKHGKKYKEAAKRISPEAAYGADEAVELVKALASAQFDETVQAGFRLGIAPRPAAQVGRGTVSPPHGAGQSG